MDHSDSFREIIDEADESAYQDKSVESSMLQSKDKDKSMASDVTPRKQPVKEPFERLELEESPESKFAIQMSPQKEEIQPEPIKRTKKKHPEKKVVVKDHG